MRKFLKRKCMILIMIILVVLSAVRIYTVNEKQRVKETHTYGIDEAFVYDGFQVRVREANYYSADKIKELCKEIPEEVLSENEMLIELEIKNQKTENHTFSITPFTLQIGMENGGSIDPYLFPYLNPKLGGNIPFEKEETKTVTLAFPIEKGVWEAKKQIKLMLSLYPEKYEIVLRE